MGNKSPLLKEYSRASYGGGLTFLPDVVLWEEFAKYGMTIRAFRHFLKALGVPVIVLKKARLVRVQSFKMALLAISRVGRPDFAAPGVPRSVAEGVDRRLDEKAFQADFDAIVAEMLFTQAASGHKIVGESARLANETAKRMVVALMHTAPLRAQAVMDRKNKAIAFRLGGRTPKEAMEDERRTSAKAPAQPA